MDAGENSLLIGKDLNIISSYIGKMKETIKEIIVQFHESELPEAIKRDYALRESEEIRAITGMRRVGKTFLLHQKIRELEKKGIPRKRILLMNFEDERLAEIKAGEMQLILKAYYELYPELTNKRVWLFFDEVQAAPKWQLFLRRLHESKKFTIFITGSSSKLLSRELATELRGRTLATEVLPLSFREFLRFKEFNLKQNIEYSERIYLLKKLFQEFITLGGYPRVALSQTRMEQEELLRTYLDLTIYKDVIERYSVRNLYLLKEMIRYYSTNIAKSISLNKYYKSVQQGISKNTVWEYFSYLEELGLFTTIRKYSYNLKEQNRSAKKVYIADTGLATISGFRFSEDKGRLLENAVFIELKRRGKEVYYHKDKKECDFITTEKGKPTEAIQVTWELNQENQKRETEGLKEAMQKHNIKKGTIITNDQEQTTNNIKITPAWKWMLE